MSAGSFADLVNALHSLADFKPRLRTYDRAFLKGRYTPIVVATVLVSSQSAVPSLSPMPIHPSNAYAELARVASVWLER
jgi:hypothetical protein